MSVKTIKNNSMLNFGTLAEGMGMVTEQPWLTALGQGMKAYHKLRNPKDDDDDGYNTPGFQNQNNAGILGSLFGWGNPDLKTQKGK